MRKPARRADAKRVALLDDSDFLMEVQTVPVKRCTLPKSHHLRSPLDFDAVYAARTREFRGPLTVYAKPNDLSHPRLGMSVSRKVGIAVRRNRIRRLIREGFRLMQHDLPLGYDLVIVVKPHAPLLLADYQKILSATVVKLHNSWTKRRTTKNRDAGG